MSSGRVAAPHPLRRLAPTAPPRLPSHCLDGPSGADRSRPAGARPPERSDQQQKRSHTLAPRVRARQPALSRALLRGCRQRRVALSSGLPRDAEGVADGRPTGAGAAQAVYLSLDRQLRQTPTRDQADELRDGLLVGGDSAVAPRARQGLYVALPSSGSSSHAASVPGRTTSGRSSTGSPAGENDISQRVQTAVSRCREGL